jgi:hypothetical protein
MLIGVILLTPASAHPGTPSHLWNDHLKEKAKDVFFTKAQSNNRFVNESDVAFALVDQNPLELVDEWSQNFDDVTRPDTGIYCLTPSPGINLTGRTVVAAPEWGLSQGFDFVTLWYADAADCTAGDIEVLTYDGGVLANSAAFSVYVA